MLIKNTRKNSQIKIQFIIGIFNDYVTMPFHTDYILEYDFNEPTLNPIGSLVGNKKQKNIINHDGCL